MGFFGRLLSGLTDNVLRKEYGRRTDECFTSAAKVYAFTGEDSARRSALAIAKAMDGQPRLGLIVWTDKAIGRLAAFADRDDHLYREAESRLRSLREVILARDWNRADAIDEINRLQQTDPEYLMALRTLDVSAFRRRHPGVFSKELWTSPYPL